jgi:sulfate adenylyltransferase subunit 1
MIDVNTGEHLPAETIEKNEIAVCKVEFTEKIVVDEFKKNKTLGELILIDRVSHMTSACGVVENVNANDETPYFEKDDLRTGGYIFEEFYFNLDNAFLSKVYTGDKTYHVGDDVPVEGDSFKYPDYFDIIAVDDGVAILIRNRQIFDIVSLKNYQYMGLPMLDERGFALKIRSEADLDNFLYEHKNVDKDNRLEFHNKWSKFETYRRVVCTDNFWMI